MKYYETRKKKISTYFLLLATIICFSSCREGPPNEVYSIDDIHGTAIGALNGTPSARLAEELGTARTFYTGDELINGLIEGIVDCALMEAVVASEIVAGKSGVKILSETLLEHELRFAVPRENAQLLAAINNALAALNADGTLRGIRDKYLSGRNYSYTAPNNVEGRPGALRLAVPLDSPPYAYIDENGDYTGLYIEVARAVCDQLGVELEIIEVDSRELVTAVWFGRAEIAAGWLPDDVEEQVHITDAYADTAYVVIVRK